jgi:carbonic anhydrase
LSGTFAPLSPAQPAPPPAPAPAPRKADTFLVACIDPRVVDETEFFMAALGRTDRYSEMRIAGAALAAVDAGRPAWREALFDNLAASRALHGIRKVTFINHRDCGAVNLWAGRSLAADPAEELRIHAEILNRAAEEVRARHPDLLIEIKLMDLDGSVSILPCQACIPQGFRAEAVGLAAQAIARASAAGGARLEMGALRAAEPQANGTAFAELVRLRSEAGPLTPEAELALLTEGVTRYGLSAEEARTAFEAEARSRGIATGAAGRTEVQGFLEAQADAQRRVGRRDVEQASALYRRLTGNTLTEAESLRRVLAIMTEAGLQPRPEGVFRSTAWFRRMNQA